MLARFHLLLLLLLSLIQVTASRLCLSKKFKIHMNFKKQRTNSDMWFHLLLLLISTASLKQKHHNRLWSDSTTNPNPQLWIRFNNTWTKLNLKHPLFDFLFVWKEHSNDPSKKNNANFSKKTMSISERRKNDAKLSNKKYSKVVLRFQKVIQRHILMIQAKKKTKLKRSRN